MSAINLAFPYAIAPGGRTALCVDADHVRQMIELVLFTRPGERVMRPEFGTGLLQFVFAPNSPEIGAALQLTIQAALTESLGDLIDLRQLQVETVESELRVTLAYALRHTGETHTETFSRPTP